MSAMIACDCKERSIGEVETRPDGAPYRAVSLYSHHILRILLPPPRSYISMSTPPASRMVCEMNPYVGVVSASTFRSAFRSVVLPALSRPISTSFSLSSPKSVCVPPPPKHDEKHCETTTRDEDRRKQRVHSFGAEYTSVSQSRTSSVSSLSKLQASRLRPSVFGHAICDCHSPRYGSCLEHRPPPPTRVNACLSSTCISRR